MTKKRQSQIASSALPLETDNMPSMNDLLGEAGTVSSIRASARQYPDRHDHRHGRDHTDPEIAVDTSRMPSMDELLSATPRGGKSATAQPPRTGKPSGSDFAKRTPRNPAVDAIIDNSSSPTMESLLRAEQDQPVVCDTAAATVTDKTTDQLVVEFRDGTLGTIPAPGVPDWKRLRVGDEISVEIIHRSLSRQPVLRFQKFLSHGDKRAVRATAGGATSQRR